MSMIRFFVAMTVMSALLAAGEADSKKPKAQKAEAVSTLPAGAETVNESTWRYTDAQGKVWIYSKTPFGYSKKEEGTAAVAVKEKPKATYKVLQVKGEAVTFESGSVFGKSRWTKNRAELDETEKASLDAYESAGNQ